MSPTTHLSLLGALTGSAWGALAYLLGRLSFGPSIWPGIIASPLIGAVVAGLIHPRFAEAEGWRRAGWALVSLYLGGILFALAVGVGDVVTRKATLEAAVSPIIGVLWGLTLTGYIIALWPLAHCTHWLIEERLARVAGPRV